MNLPWFIWTQIDCRLGLIREANTWDRDLLSFCSFLPVSYLSLFVSNSGS